jgi:hypothetical protein
LPFTGLNDLGPIIGTASVLLGGGALAFARRKGR